MRDLSKCMPSKQVVQPLIHIIRHGLPGDDPQDVLSLPSDWLLQSLERSGVQTRCRTASSTHGSTLAPLSGRRARPSGRCRASRSLCTVFSRLSRETQRLMDSCRHRRGGSPPPHGCKRQHPPARRCPAPGCPHGRAAAGEHQEQLCAHAAGHRPGPGTGVRVCLWAVQAPTGAPTPGFGGVWINVWGVLGYVKYRCKILIPSYESVPAVAAVSKCLRGALCSSRSNP